MRRLFAFYEINRNWRVRKSWCDYARYYNDVAEVAANRRRSIGPIMRTTLTSFSFISRCVRIIRHEWVESRGRNRGRLATPRELERRNCAAVVEPERRPLGNYHNFIISSFQGSFPAVSSRLNAPRTRYWRALASVYPLSFVFVRFFRGQAWDQVSAGGRRSTWLAQLLQTRADVCTTAYRSSGLHARSACVNTYTQADGTASEDEVTRISADKRSGT